MSEQPGGLTTFINNLENEFKAMSGVESGANFEKEAHYAMQLLSKNKYLLNQARTNPQSLRNAVLNISATGLSLDPVQKLAYLIPRKGEVCLDISYLGLVRLATDSGNIIHVISRLIYEEDNFSVHGSNKEPTHEYKPFADRGELLGCAVWVKTIEGNYLTETMSMKEIDKIRDTSEAFKKGYGPWKEYPGEMIRKTVIKRAAKLWPRTNKFHLLDKAISIANQYEGIDFETEREKDEKGLLEDFPTPPEEMVVGSEDYRFLYGKFRAKQIKDVPTENLEDYVIYLEKKQKSKGLDKKYTEILTSMLVFLENFHAPIEE